MTNQRRRRPASMLPRMMVRGLVRQHHAEPVTDPVSFDLAPGAGIALLGAPGSGRSTVVEMLLGRVRPSAGGVLVRDRHGVRRNDRSRVISAVLDTRAVDPRQTVRAHVHRAALLAGAEQTGVEETLERLDLGDTLPQRVDDLWPAVRIRLVLALAELNDPDLLVLESPEHWMLPDHSDGALRHLRRQRARGLSVVVSTADGELARRLTDDALVFDQGRLVRQGSLQDALAAVEAVPEVGGRT